MKIKIQSAASSLLAFLKQRHEKILFSEREGIIVINESKSIPEGYAEMTKQDVIDKVPKNDILKLLGWES